MLTKKQITIEVYEYQYRTINSHAENGRSAGDVIREAIDTYIKSKEGAVTLRKHREQAGLQVTKAPSERNKQILADYDALHPVADILSRYDISRARLYEIVKRYKE